MSERVILLQRVVPHYRAPLFERLYRDLGWRVVCAANAPEGTHLSLAAADGDAVVGYPFRFSRSNPHRCRVPTARILRELRPSAVIAEFSLQMSSTWELLAQRKLAGGPPVVYWSHGYNMDRGLGLAGWPYQVPRVALGLLADAHVVYSEEGRDFLARFVPESRVRVVRNSLPWESMRLAEGDTRTDRPRPALISVGRLTPDKDAPGLVHAFRLLLRRFPTARLVIVGDGPDAGRTRAAASDLLGKSVEMPGAVYDDERLASLMHAADAAVFAGAVGLSVNHALLHGLPVIAHARTPRGPRHHPEIAYVVDDRTGRTIDRPGPDALADGIAAFFERYPDPRAALGPSIREYVRSNLLLDSMLRDFGHVQRMLHDLGD